MFKYRDARKYAKENITGKKGRIFGYYILYLIFQGLITGIIENTFNGFIGLIIGAVISGVVTPIHVGLFRIVTNIMNNKEVKFSMLFEDYKYFVNLFVIGLVCNLAISIGYHILYIPGLLLSFIYVGILYLFIYNSDLSLNDFYNKAVEKVKLYYQECISLEFSYLWPIYLIVIVYTLIILFLTIFYAIGNISQIINSIQEFNFVSLLTGFIPFIIVTIVFIIALFVVAIMIIPNLLLAEAKFYSAFASDKSEEKAQKFCSNCGTKMEGKFCTNCGTKNKE